jgi:hypothetical protein
MKSYTAQYANNLTTVPRKAVSELKAHRSVTTYVEPTFERS